MASISNEGVARPSGFRSIIDGCHLAFHRRAVGVRLGLELEPRLAHAGGLVHLETKFRTGRDRLTDADVVFGDASHQNLFTPGSAVIVDDVDRAVRVLHAVGIGNAASLVKQQPAFDQLIQITRTLAHDDDFVRVVLVSTQSDVQGDVRFIEVSDGPEYRTDLQQALREGLLALGLLGWEFKDGTLQAKGGLFPWQDERLRELFDRLCEEGVDRVQEEFARWNSR